MLNEFVAWYFEILPKIENTIDLFDNFITFLQEHQFQIIRANIGTRTLHPQVETLSYLWAPYNLESMLETTVTPFFHSTRDFQVKSGLLKESRFKVGSTSSTQFTKSPIQYILSNNKSYSYQFTDEKPDEYPFPILEELAPFGASGYLAVPIVQKGNSLAFLSLLTKKPGGFSADDLDFLEKALKLISLKWMTFLQSEMTESLLGIYLGKMTGSTVYSGKIYLGEHEKINSVVWFSDIRNYSGISEELSPTEVIQLLNAYFGLAIPIIESYGGEVLKLLGDGILAVFPYSNSNQVLVGKKVLLAVRKISDDLMNLNKKREKDGKIPFFHGVGLHSGEILYGNIGSKDRLDFTVIGEAVNLTSRIAGMCGELKKAVLVSENLADQVPVKWEYVGEHKLKGISNPKRIFGISEKLK
ncbi:MAG: adenylate/guanylate cyclase domain-containing protein [Leptospira sp.]|nr:adenylate/guanylate cyclase domain-containing protein [Leptospira sp.]